jgi:hypothetical protein
VHIYAWADKLHVKHSALEVHDFERPHIRALGSFVEFVATSKFREYCHQQAEIYPASEHFRALPTTALTKDPEKPEEHILFTITNWAANDDYFDDEVPEKRGADFAVDFEIVAKLVSIGRGMRKLSGE